MSDVVLIQIPVSRSAAAALSEESRREKIGKLVSDLLRPETPDSDPLAALISEIKADARAVGLTDEDIDAELAATTADHPL